VPVVVASKSRYQGTVSIASLNTEVVVVDVPAQGDDYMVEGYIDLSALGSGDAVEVREYIAVDGSNLVLFASAQLQGPLASPVLRFHTKTLLYNMRYRVTVIQTSGTPRSFPYGFIVEVLGTV